MLSLMTVSSNEVDKHVLCASVDYKYVVSCTFTLLKHLKTIFLTLPNEKHRIF